MSAAEGSNARSVVVIGALPPPVHGMATITAGVVGALRPRCDLHVGDTSPGSLCRGLAYHLRKAGRLFLAGLLLLRRRLSGRPVLYFPADAGWGMLYSSTLAAVGRILGYDVVIHHHSFAYLRHRSRRMALVTRCAGRRACHVVLCPTMDARLRDLYPYVRRSLVASNAWVLEATAERSPGPRRELRLGHLSNLSLEKGLDLVVDTQRRLLAAGIPSRLVLGGSPVDDEARRVLEAAESEFETRLEHWDRVDHENKDSFLSSIDVFLFPSRADEAQPLVILEAMAHGVPVLATDSGCVRGMLEESGGAAVSRGARFVDEVLPFVERWATDQAALDRASRAARQRFIAMHRAARDDLATLLDRLTRGGSRSA